MTGSSFRVSRAAAAGATRLNVARSTAFTLIELITVIGIMALMIVIAVPAFQSVTKSSAVGIGAGQLVNTLMLARSKAVASRTHVRVIFASESATNALYPNATAYAVLQLTNRENSASLVNWIYLDRWQILPKGAFFSGFVSPASTSLSLVNIPFPANTNVASSTINARVIEFNSAGALTSSVDANVAVQEGVILPNGTAGSRNTANTNTVVVQWITGRAKILR
ncbi:MAG: pilus assembly FimT family protein [Verrucomicrobiia bacterium]